MKVPKVITTPIVFYRLFLQDNLFISNKRDTKITKTNHYILLTNVSNKRCIRPGSEPGSSGGGEFQPDKYRKDNNSCYPSHEFNVLDII